MTPAIWHDLPLPAIIIDGSEVILYANPAAGRIFALGEACIGKLISEYEEKKSDKLIGLLRRVRKEGQAMSDYGAKLRWRARPVGLVDLHAAPLAGKQQHILLLICPRNLGHYDDTPIVARRAISGMVSALTHEIGNPLAAISGAAQLLEKQNADNRDMAVLIGDEVSRIKVLLERFEQFSENIGLKPASVNIHDVLDQVSMAAECGYGADTRYVKQYDPSLPDCAGDRDQLIRLFTNLVKNATESVSRISSAKDRQITLKTRYESGIRVTLPDGSFQEAPLHVDIVDNGPGIEPSIREHIFAPFVTSKRDGTGIGLAITSKIAQDHGGLITCESYPGNTCFSVALPIWQGGDAA